MSNIRKKNISLILAIILFVSIIPQIIFANTPLVYMVNGVIKMEFDNKKAETGTRFKTVGWIVHATEGNGNAAKTQKYGKMVDDDFEQKAENEIAPGIVRTYFEIDKDVVSQAFINGGLGGIPDNTTVFLDSVFTVTHNGVSNGKYYYTLKDIQNAAPWGSQTMKDLENYFDVPVEFDSGEYPLAQEFRVNGEIVDKKQLLEDKSGTVHNVIFPEKITLKDGSEAVLKDSFEYYNLLRGVSNKKIMAPKPEAYKRPTTIIIGGTTSVGEYVKEPLVTVRHINKDTNTTLEEFSEKVQPGQTYSASTKDFSPLHYVYSMISNDGGKTWKDRSDKTTRNVIVNKDTIIAFYYSKETDIMADLRITANPDSVKKDSTATVKFKLDANGSKSKYPIVKYEFWFGEDSSDLTGSVDYTTEWPSVEINKGGVAPRSEWHGKVRITDTQGKQAEATATITIGESSNPAEVKAAIDVNFHPTSLEDDGRIYNLVDYINRVETVYRDSRFPGSFTYPAKVIYLDEPDKSFFDDQGKPRYGLSFDAEVDGSKSKSTNGIGKTELMYNYNSSEEEMKIGEPYSATFPKKGIAPDDVMWIWKQLEHDKYDWVERQFAVTAYDSVQTDKSDKIYMYVYFVGIPQIKELDPPSVELGINRHTFTLGETVGFSPTYYEQEGKTYKILDKSWEIFSTTNEFKESGKGDIPANYKLQIGEGQYKARQYIHYKDAYENDLSVYDEEWFEVISLRDPDVSIASDKEKYFIPTTGIFTVTYDEDPKYTHYIDRREYALKDSSGNVISTGEGTFPKEYFFEDTLPSGYYSAEQTIYWWVEGTEKSKTATCTFKLISPVPTSDFIVNMKMSTNNDDWLRIDVPGESGKQYKQIRIDLTPSIKLNQDLENPNPIDFTSANTQIQVLPLTEDLQADRSKNNTIHTPNAADKQLVDDTVTFKGKQYIDVRFDEPGKYRIKTRVASGKYISQWLVRDIIIRKDLPPIVDLELKDVTNQEGRYFTYRSNNDLRVRFGIGVSARPQDDDIVDYSTGKLEIRYDYNSDFDTSNDGVHSSMWVTQNTQNLQSYVTVNKGAEMRDFSVDMYNPIEPILGKIRLEYLVAEQPTIPNFIGGSMPNVPINYGTTYGLPDDKKILWVDNKQGSIKMYLEGKTKKELIIVMPTDTMFFDIDTLKNYYGNDISIYVIDKTGKKERIH